jgi:DNA-directed RNA polymerase subunit RPC12/RpoP
MNSMQDEVAQCPDCGTTRLVVRKRRDPIDRYDGGLLAWWRRKMGAKLYHCIFCRLQFYSSLPLAAAPAEYDDIRAADAPALNRQD